jgi:hypothetical protein
MARQRGVYFCAAKYDFIDPQKLPYPYCLQACKSFYERIYRLAMTVADLFCGVFIVG